MSVTQDNDQSAKDTSRVEAFSDGVFAIAITLLILDIHVPEFTPNASLVGVLFSEWPSLLAFLIGFFTLLVCWINHHYMFRMIHRTDSVLLLINGFKLLVVTLTPVATAVLSKHIRTGWQPAAVNIYCLNFALMGIAMMALWSYADRTKCTKASSAKRLLATTRLYVFAGAFATTIWLVSFVSIVVCLILSSVMFAIFLFPQRSSDWLVKGGNG